MKKESVKKFFSNKTTRTVLVLLAALILLFAVYKVFFPAKKKTGAYVPTEQEERLSNILSRIDGVSDATVMIGEEEGVAVSAVIVFSGADSILTRIRVIDAASGALGLKKENIRVYPAEK